MAQFFNMYLLKYQNFIDNEEEAHNKIKEEEMNLKLYNSELEKIGVKLEKAKNKRQLLEDKYNEEISSFSNKLPNNFSFAKETIYEAYKIVFNFLNKDYHVLNQFFSADVIAKIANNDVREILLNYCKGKVVFHKDVEKLIILKNNLDSNPEFVKETILEQVVDDKVKKIKLDITKKKVQLCDKTEDLIYYEKILKGKNELGQTLFNKIFKHKTLKNQQKLLSLQNECKVLNEQIENLELKASDVETLKKENFADVEQQIKNLNVFINYVNLCLKKQQYITEFENKNISTLEKEADIIKNNYIPFSNKVIKQSEQEIEKLKVDKNNFLIESYENSQFVDAVMFATEDSYSPKTFKILTDIKNHYENYMKEVVKGLIK